MVSVCVHDEPATGAALKDQGRGTGGSAHFAGFRDRRVAEDEGAKAASGLSTPMVMSEKPGSRWARPGMLRRIPATTVS